MRRLLAGLFAMFIVVLPAAASAERVRALIDINDQTMTVDWGGGAVETWTVSTGGRRSETPTGRFRGYRWSKDHWSSQFDAPMPWAVFIHQGYAIHANDGRLGRPTSHGCVRLSIANARRFYEETRRRGVDVEIIGSTAEAVRSLEPTQRERTRTSGRSGSAAGSAQSRFVASALDDAFVPRSQR